MRTVVKKSRSHFLAIALWVPLQAGLAQDKPSAPPPAPSTSAPTTGSPTEIDSSTSAGLDYLFNHKATEGSTMKAGNELASALADKIKAVDVLKTPVLDDPEVRARFQTYLSLKEVPDDRIKEYFGKMKQVSDVLKSGDAFGAWKILYAMSEYTDLDAGISRELANRVESIWTNDRNKNGIEQANEKLRNNIESYDHNADMIADDLHHQELEDQQKAAKGQNNAGAQNNQNNQGNATNSPLLNPNADPAAAENADNGGELAA